MYHNVKYIYIENTLLLQGVTRKYCNNFYDVLQVKLIPLKHF